MTDDTTPPDLFDGDHWLTPDELSGWLKLTKDWLYDQVQAGRLPCHKFGRQIRFRHSEIQAWLRERRPANAYVRIQVTWPDGTKKSTFIDVRDLLGDAEHPQPNPIEEPTEVIVVQANVDEAGMEIT